MKSSCYCNLSVVVDRICSSAWVVECPRCGLRMDATTSWADKAMSSTLYSYTPQRQDSPEEGR